MNVRLSASILALTVAMIVRSLAHGACLLGTTAYDGPGGQTDNAESVMVDAIGNILVAGYEMGISGGYNWRVNKYDATLTTMLASTDYSASGNAADCAYDVALDNGGNIIVVGSETVIGGGVRWRVQKYDATLSVLLASTEYAGPGNGPSKAFSVTVDGSGNIIVAGNETGATLNWRVRKYNASLTTLLGNTDYDGPNHMVDAALAIAVDGGGNIIVAGSESASTRDWRIRKYDSSLTVLLGSANYNGPANGDDHACTVVLDGSGNIFVAGYEQAAVGMYNWRIRKYGPSLDTLLAETYYDGPAANWDFPYGLAIDKTGAVYAAGQETGLAGGRNWEIRKYDNTLSTLLGSTDYDGPASLADSANSIALDAGDNVVVAGYEVRGAYGDWRVRRCDMAGACAPLIPAIAVTATLLGTPAIGSQITCRIVITNTGNVNFTDVDLVDTISPTVTGTTDYRPAPFGPPTVTDSPGSGTCYAWSTGGLAFAPGNSLTFTLTGIAGMVCVASTLTNAAHATATGPSGNAFAQAVPRTSPLAPPTFTVALTVAESATVVRFGDSLTYRIDIVNSGTATITSLIVVDTIHPSLVVDATFQHPMIGPPVVTDILGGSRYVWSASGLTWMPGETYSFTLQGTAGTVTAPTAMYNGSVAVAASECGTLGKYSNTVVSTVFPPFVPPGMPGNLTALPMPAAIMLGWIPAAAGTHPVHFYQVWRATCSGCAFSLFGTSPGSTTWFRDALLPPGVEFCYRVRAVDISGATGFMALPVCASADPGVPAMDVQIMASNLNPSVGDLVTITVRATNTGTTPLQNVVASIMRPPGSQNSWLDNGPLSYRMGGEGNSNVALLNPGDVNECSFRYRAVSPGTASFTTSAQAVNPETGMSLVPPSQSITISVGATTQVVVIGGRNGYVNPLWGESVQIVWFCPIIYTSWAGAYRSGIRTTIYDWNGRQVWTEERLTVRIGDWNTTTWNCRSNNGRIVAPGAYGISVRGRGVRYRSRVAVHY